MIYLKDKQRNVYVSMNSADKEKCLKNWLDVYTEFLSSNKFKEKEGKRLSIIKLTNEYLEHTWKRVSLGEIKAQSCRNEEKRYKRIIPYLKSNKIKTTDKVRKDSFSDYGEEKLLAGYAVKTVNGDIVQLNAFLAWLVSKDYIELKHQPKIKKIKDNKNYAKESNPAFTGEHYKVLLDIVNRYEIREGEDRDEPDVYQAWFNRRLFGCFVRFLYHSGCRPHEALLMDMSMVDVSHYKLKEGQTTLRGLLRIPDDSKTGFRESVINGTPIMRVIDHLKAYSHPTNKFEITDETFLFSNTELNHQALSVEMFRYHWKECLRLCGLDSYGYTLYSLRSTYITQMLLNGTAVEDVARNVGNSPETIYKHYDNVQNILKSDELLKLNKWFKDDQESRVERSEKQKF